VIATFPNVLGFKHGGLHKIRKLTTDGPPPSFPSPHIVSLVPLPRGGLRVPSLTERAVVDIVHTPVALLPIISVHHVPKGTPPALRIHQTLAWHLSRAPAHLPRAAGVDVTSTSHLDLIGEYATGALTRFELPTTVCNRAGSGETKRPFCRNDCRGHVSCGYMWDYFDHSFPHISAMTNSVPRWRRVLHICVASDPPRGNVEGGSRSNGEGGSRSKRCCTEEDLRGGEKPHKEGTR